MTEYRSITPPGADAAGPRALRGLLIDWGGVLTTGLPDAMGAWAERDGVDFEHFQAVMREWLGTRSGGMAEGSPIHALERGEMTGPEFEDRLAARLRTHDGRPVVAEGLLRRMFGGFGAVPEMREATARAKSAGIRTCLLSNSWGLDYPREGWDELFDAAVISGEVGMRKPEERIFRYAADQLGLPPRACVFVDDLRPNVRAAADLGMVGVHHVAVDQTVGELEVLFGVPLRGVSRRTAG